MSTTLNNFNIIRKTAAVICRFTGHHWRYKDYANWINEKGESYDFKASRNCTRCNRYEYLYKYWESRIDKLPLDMQSNESSTRYYLPLQTH